MEKIAFTQFNSRFGLIRLVWKKSNAPKIMRVLLPNSISDPVFRRMYSEAERDSYPAIEKVCEAIIRFLNGDNVHFDISSIDLSLCNEFQRSVLQTEYRIPRGWVSTYRRIAQTLGKPNGARAVGHALAGNPFPIIIPCHRAILSNGGLGGFQGGVKMKMELLKAEGIEFSASGKVIMKRVYY